MVVMSKSLATHIPSGKHTKNSWKWPSRIVALPIKKVIFHSFFQNRVIYHQTVKNRVILPIKIVPIKLPIEKVIFHSYVAVYQRVQFLQQLLPWWWSTCLSIPRLDEFPQSFTCQPAWANSPIEMMQNAPLCRCFMVDDGWWWLMMVDDGWWLMMFNQILRLMMLMVVQWPPKKWGGLQSHTLNEMLNQ